MLPSSQFIPYSVSSLPEGRWLVFAPHADDEILGMGGVLLHARDKNIEVYIAYVTDGAKGGDAQVRQVEAQEVCARLGANPVFMAMPDGETLVTPEATAKFSALIKQVEPSVIFFPAPQEYHPDHRATASLTWGAIRDVGYSGEVFSYEISRQCEANVLVDISHVANEKKELLGIYTSQLGQNNYLQVMDSINVSRTYTLPSIVTYAEAFFKYQHTNIPLLHVHRERTFQYFDAMVADDFPIISVLIRTQNRRDFLVRALRSLLKQHNKEFIDVVIVNDGGESIDDLLPEFELSFWRVKRIDLPVVRGRAAAANVALNHAKGKFINFLDDDDEFDANHFQVFLWHWRRKREIEVFYRGVRVLSANGEFIREYNDAFDAGALMSSNFIPIHAVTFSRKFIDMGCRFDESLEFLEDWDFWLQLSRLTPFVHSKSVTATYHKVGSSSASPDSLGILDSQSHRNKILDKWQSKWTSVEVNRMLQAQKKALNRLHQQEINKIKAQYEGKQ